MEVGSIEREEHFIDDLTNGRTLKVIYLTTMLSAKEVNVATLSMDILSEPVLSESLGRALDDTIVVVSLPSPSRRMNSFPHGILTCSLWKSKIKDHLYIYLFTIYVRIDAASDMDSGPFLVADWNRVNCGLHRVEIDLTMFADEDRPDD